MEQKLDEATGTIIERFVSNDFAEKLYLWICFIVEKNLPFTRKTEDPTFRSVVKPKMAGGLAYKTLMKYLVRLVKHVKGKISIKLPDTSLGLIFDGWSDGEYSTTTTKA